MKAPWMGPFGVVEFKDGREVVVQDLLTLKHRTFHIERVKRFTPIEGVDPKEAAAMDSGEDLVEAIVDHEVTGKDSKKWLFRVRWTGWGEEDDTWEDWEEVRPLEALDAYLGVHPELGKISPKLRVHRGGVARRHSP